MATIADIIKSQREAGTSRTDSVLSELGSKTKEKLDPRNYLFKRSGTLTSLFPSLKGYQASVSKDTTKALKTDVSGNQAEVMTSRLDEISKDIKIVSKNSLALPLIAKEINIMRQNIALLVKGGKTTPRTRASSFFEEALAKETSIEAARSTAKTTTPTQVGKIESDKKESGGFLSSLFSGLLSKAALVGLAGLGSAFFLSENFRNKITSFLDNIFGQLLGDDTWQSIKNLLSNILESFKKAIVTVGSKAFDVMGVTPDGLKESVKDVGLATAGAVGTGVVVKKGLDAGARKFVGKPLTGKLVGEQEKIKNEVMEKIKDPKTKRFMKYLLKKSPTLFYKLGQRLVLSAGLLAIPIVGWIGSLVTLGLSLFTAYQIFGIYLDFLKEDEKEPKLQDNKPEQINPQLSDTTSETVTGAKSSSQQRNQTSPSKLPETQGLGKMDLSGLSDEQLQMANLIYQKFIEAGFTPEQAMGAIKNAYAESRLNPNASNTNGEDSWGLFQMNRKGGLGTGYTPEQLKNPEVNIALAVREALKSNNFKKATTIAQATEAFMKDVERPFDQSASAVAKRVAGLSTEPPVMVAQGPEDMLKESLNSSMSSLSSFMNNLQTNMNGDKMKEFSNEFESLVRELMKPSETGTTNVINNSPSNVNNVSAGKGNIASTYNNEYVSNLLLHKSI